MIVRAPASSANLGPGFDCLGLAVDLPFDLTDERPPSGGGVAWHRAEPGHPAVVAYGAAGADPSRGLHWRSPIPPGRGLGYSGAARVAGAALALTAAGAGPSELAAESFAVAAALEGHPDNAAASAHGGFTVAAGGRVVRLDVPAGLALVVWWPRRSTSTDVSRRGLPERVPLSDTVDSLSRTALWVAAVATGRTELLGEASDDHLHQPFRLAERPDSAAVLTRWRARPEVLAAWLSGSGPTVAALVRDEDAAAVAEDDPGDPEDLGDGVRRILPLSPTGVALLPATGTADGRGGAGDRDTGP